MPSEKDSRFGALKTDPRFRPLSQRAGKLKVDARFRAAVQSCPEDFTTGLETDKYGRRYDGVLRRSEPDAEVAKFYDLLDQSDDSNESDDNEDDGKAQSQTENEDDVKDDTADDEAEDSVFFGDEDKGGKGGYFVFDELLDRGDEIPEGDITRRVALVNQDWDLVKAVDIFTIMQSCMRLSCGQAGQAKLNRVAVYLSDFGAERVSKENLFGPQLQPCNQSGNQQRRHTSSQFNKSNEPKPEISSDEEQEENDHSQDEERDEKKNDDDDDDDDDSDVEDDEVVKANLVKKYQLERLRYYYAVCEFDSASTAQKVVDYCQGAEIELSGNILDLRYIPHEDDPSGDGVLDPKRVVTECFGVSEHEAARSAAAAAAAFGGAGMSSGTATAGLQHSNAKITWDLDTPDRAAFVRSARDLGAREQNDVSAFIAASGSDSEESLFDDDSDTEEEEIEERDKKERIAKRKEELAQQRRRLLGLDETDERKGKRDEDEEEEVVFGDKEVTFNEDHEALAAKAAQKLEERAKQRELKGETAIEKFKRKQRERREIRRLRKLQEEQEQEEAKEEKDNERSSVKKQPKRKGKRSRTEDEEENDSDDEAKSSRFKVDVADTRFSSVLEDHEFAIDPTSAHFKDTENMRTLLAAKRARTETTASTSRNKDCDTTLESKSDSLLSLAQRVQSKSHKNAKRLAHSRSRAKQ